jgi:hypothetical protein
VTSIAPAVYSPRTPRLTYSVAEACQTIGCESEDWLLDRVRNGMFPARRIVREVRFTDNDLAAILNACRLEPRGVTVAEPLPVPTARSSRSRRKA